MDSLSDEIESILFIAREVMVYQLPPRTTVSGYKAAEWNVESFVWKGRLRVVEIGDRCDLKLEASDSISAISRTHICFLSGDGLFYPPPPPQHVLTSSRPHHLSSLDPNVFVVMISSTPIGQPTYPLTPSQDTTTGELFAQVTYAKPWTQVEPVLDSSRYFVLRVEGEGGKRAYVGMGFQERGEAFDFQVALQSVAKRSAAPAPGTGASSEPSKPAAPPKDYSLKEGQTFKINLPGREKKAGSASGGASGGSLLGGAGGGGGGGGGGGLFSLPPPPPPGRKR